MRSEGSQRAPGEPAEEQPRARLASSAAVQPLPLPTASAPSMVHLSHKLSIEISNR